MIEKLLIANRGEIACRVIRTARRLGIATVAVYSDADAGARHVALADEALRIGPAPAAESYLNIPALLEAARRSGADAVHPGYGFLAENVDFAEACAAAGLVFVGPPPAAIRAMGSKSAAKRIMAGAGVPLIPGYHGEDQSGATLQSAAAGIGFPVLIKASAGGGGKGMRVVTKTGDFPTALEGARREAAAAFGDDRVLLERSLERPRHVEIQVFADGRGNVIHLFERDCSIQRRHQKVVEEAPAPGIAAELRARMGTAAVAAARAIGYVGAGTIEFLLDADGAFYFMEMNTRLQVEHPVTELITGTDLVEWQLRVAEGGALPLRQEELSLRGHAIEVRLYAEDPRRDFLPATGELTLMRTPQESAHVRLESGVRQGDEVSPYYDPLLAKLIVWDEDRPAALRRLRRALAECAVAGVRTNLELLAAVAAHPTFTAGAVDTGFIERHRAELLPEAGQPDDRILAFACLDLLLRRATEAKRAAAVSGDPHSPWHRSDGWRLNGDNHHRFAFTDDGREIVILAHYRRGGYLLELPGGELQVRGSLGNDGTLDAELHGERLQAFVVRRGEELTVCFGGRSVRLTLHDPAARFEEEDAGGRLTAPMPGKVVALMVDAGQKVERGAPLVVLEAMKMEHTITAPSAGRIVALHFTVGELVAEGAELLAFEAAAEGGA